MPGRRVAAGRLGGRSLHGRAERELESSLNTLPIKDLPEDYQDVIGLNELPEERLSADFNEDSILILTPDLVGPSVTRNSGIMSFGDMPWLFSPMA